MRRDGRLVTLAPFVVVLTLAAWIGLWAGLAAPATVIDSSPAVVPSPTAIAISTPQRTAQPPSASGSSEAAAMLRAHNDLRQAIGEPALPADGRVTAAAQRHAEYLARNAVIGHDEDPGQAGFTGANVRDRLAAQGYAAAAASEVAASVSPGTEGVRYLWDLPYHRLGLMHPHAVAAGWGHADVAGRVATVGVLVYDFGAAAPERVRSPAAGQRVPGSWSGEEFPDVLPSGAPRPVGFPIMVVFSGARAVDLLDARVTDAGGREVSHYVVPQIYEHDYVAIVPASPLAPGMRYRVRLELIVAGNQVLEEWEFATET
jgi:uncharacterized protein YkwD